jgi:hypothetical protein
MFTAATLLIMALPSQANIEFVCGGANDIVTIQRSAGCGISSSLSRSNVRLVPGTSQPSIRDLTPLAPPLSSNVRPRIPQTVPVQQAAPTPTPAIPDSLPAPAEEDIWRAVTIPTRTVSTTPTIKKFGLYKKYLGGDRNNPNSYSDWHVFMPAENGRYKYQFSLPRRGTQSSRDARVVSIANQKYFNVAPATQGMLLTGK